MQVPDRVLDALPVVGLHSRAHHAVQLLADQHDRLARLADRVKVGRRCAVDDDDAAGQVPPGRGVRMRRRVRALGVDNTWVGGLDGDQPGAGLGGRVRDTSDHTAEVEPAHERRQDADRRRSIHASPIGHRYRVMSVICGDLRRTGRALRRPRRPGCVRRPWRGTSQRRRPGARSTCGAHAPATRRPRG